MFVALVRFRFVFCSLIVVFCSCCLICLRFFLDFVLVIWIDFRLLYKFWFFVFRVCLVFFKVCLIYKKFLIKLIYFFFKLYIIIWDKILIIKLIISVIFLILFRFLLSWLVCCWYLCLRLCVLVLYCFWLVCSVCLSFLSLFSRLVRMFWIVVVVLRFFFSLVFKVLSFWNI